MQASLTFSAQLNGQNSNFEPRFFRHSRSHLLNLLSQTAPAKGQISRSLPQVRLGSLPSLSGNLAIPAQRLFSSLVLQQLPVGYQGQHGFQQIQQQIQQQQIQHNKYNKYKYNSNKNKYKYRRLVTRGSF
jgi:hypothetical protein